MVASYESGYVDGDVTNIKQMMDTFYMEGYPINSAAWREGSLDLRMKVGDQQLLSVLYGDSSFYNRRNFYFNHIRRIVNMITGYQRQHRKSSSLVSTHGKSDVVASDFTSLSMWSERREGFHEYLSQAFEGAVTTGIGLLHLYNDYTLDPVSGDLRTDSVGYNNFMIDPWWRKQDLSDCRYIWRRRWVSKEQAKQLLPGRADDIDKMRADGMKDGKFPIQAEALSSTANRLFTYDEFHYLDSREVTIVIDTKTGEAVEWEPNPDDAEDELERTLAMQPWLAVTKTRKATVKLAILLGGQEMYHGENLLKVDMYPFVPVLCYHEPDIQNYAYRQQGVVRGLRDSQYLYNRRKIIELDILESQINSGHKYKVGAVTDEACFRQTGQGFLIPINDTHEMTDVERIDPPNIPASMIELSRSLAEEITTISGVNEELLGAGDDDKPGILSMLRQGAGLTTLQTMFDKLDYSQKLYTRLRVEAIRKNWTNGKMAKILGHEPAPTLRLTDSQKYDVAVEQGMYSTTQKQMSLKQKLHFRELGMPIPDESILQDADIQNKDELIAQMQQQQQQQQQMQQAQMQQQQEEQNQKRMLDFAKAKSEMARANDYNAAAAEKTVRITDIQANAERNRTEAELNLVKQLIELEDLDLRQLRESIALAEMLKQYQQQNQVIDLVS